MVFCNDITGDDGRRSGQDPRTCPVSGKFIVIAALKQPPRSNNRLVPEQPHGN